MDAMDAKDAEQRTENRRFYLPFSVLCLAICKIPVPYSIFIFKFGMNPGAIEIGFLGQVQAQEVCPPVEYL